jgi:hypothetical protein
MEITRALQPQEEQQAKLLWYWQWNLKSKVGSVERKDEADYFLEPFNFGGHTSSSLPPFNSVCLVLLPAYRRRQVDLPLE